jgi:NAD(P)H-dependent flavin oxidoreductase YrpB (nitropropane dioxygenase family)
MASEVPAMTLQELFGIELPIIQAPMAGYQGSEMAMAAPAFPLAGAALAALRKKAESLGKGDFSPLWSGQNAAAAEKFLRRR